jgi:hypothetical protein
MQIFQTWIFVDVCLRLVIHFKLQTPDPSIPDSSMIDDITTSFFSQSYRTVLVLYLLPVYWWATGMFMHSLFEAAEQPSTDK